MRNIYLLIIALCFLDTSFAFAQKKIKDKDDFDKSGLNIMFYYQDQSYSSFFDGDGNKFGQIDIDIEKIRQKVDNDSITILNPANWTFDVNKKRFGIHVEYFFDNNNMIYLTMPFETNTLNQQITYSLITEDGFNQDLAKNEFPEQSKSFMSYLALGGEYFTYNSFFFNSILGEIRIPGGSQDYIPGSEVMPETYTGENGIEAIRYVPPWPGTNKEFLSDGAFELHLGTSVGLNFKKTQVKSTFKYLFRSEELSDQLFHSTAVFIKSMEEASLKIGYNYFHSVDTPPSDYYFDYTKTPIYDRTLNADLGFQIYLKRLIIDLNMQIPIWGTYSFSNSVFTMKLGWHI